MLTNRQDPKQVLPPISPDWTILSIDVLFKTATGEFQTGYYNYETNKWTSSRGDFRYIPKDVIVWWYLEEV